MAGIGGGVLGAAGVIGHNALTPDERDLDPVAAMMKLGVPFAMMGAITHLGSAGLRSLSNKFRGV
jgi:hypothetical protein